jgi:Leucine-rich repeat (LRR) protein
MSFYDSLLANSLCRRLALSTNQIDRMVPLNGMQRLKILSLGRNQIKKVGIAHLH